MPIIVRNISLALEQSEDELSTAVARRLGVPVSAIRNYAIVRRAIDARRKDIHFRYHVEVALDGSEANEKACMRNVRSTEVAWIEYRPEPEPIPGSQPLSERPVIVGFGPGGMFAALRLAQYGYCPIVLERGRDVRRRHRDIMQRYYKERDFDPESNLLFGEGGAGTYSDGKLYTRISDPRSRMVLETFYQHGADPDILVNTRPHVGSDQLPTICTRIRRRIEALGGEIRFECKLDDIRLRADEKIADSRYLSDIHVCGPGSSPDGAWMACGPVILSVGHSARNTIRMISERGVVIVPKPFQIGVRIEHPQAMVDHWQYGAAAGHRRLSAAEYHVVAKGAAGAAGDVFSFCMCPGGMILPTNESAGLIATNGASGAARSGAFANSGLVMTVDPEELGLGPLEAMEFQRRWEQKAFEATGGSYQVPMQRAEDFLAGRASDGALTTSYPLGGRWSDIRSLIPPQVGEAVARALPKLSAKFAGFAGKDALIAAPETRASAPVRISRDPTTREAVGTANLYPVGEGAGYAGGIVSVAVDGLKTADAIIERYARPE